MRNKDYHLNLTDNEYGRIVSALINLKNDLIAQGRYTMALMMYCVKLQPQGKRK